MLFISSCSDTEKKALVTPFVTVVKLKSAEENLQIDEAMQYIDVVQVYSKLGSKDPIEDWKKRIKFEYNLGKDKKFSNAFGYFKYDIEETIIDHKAFVCFTDKDTNSSIRKINYKLEKCEGKWIVVSIDYFK